MGVTVENFPNNNNNNNNKRSMYALDILKILHFFLIQGRINQNILLRNKLVKEVEEERIIEAGGRHNQAKRPYRHCTHCNRDG